MNIEIDETLAGGTADAATLVERSGKIWLHLTKGGRVLLGTEVKEKSLLSGLFKNKKDN